MKEQNWVNLLRNWSPRPPSSELREKLFPTTASERRSPDRQESTRVNLPIRRSAFLAGYGSHLRWNWLAPATVCALTMLVILGGGSSSTRSLGRTDTNLFFASITMTSVASSNSEGGNIFALSKRDMNLERNVWREAIFDSTNGGQSPSSKRSLTAMKTNGLTR